MTSTDGAATTTVPMVKAETVCKNFGALKVLKGVTLEIAKGQVLVLLGVISGGFCLLGHFIGSGMMMKNGSKIVRPVIITVLALLFIKVISDMMAG